MFAPLAHGVRGGCPTIEGTRLRDVTLVGRDPGALSPLGLVVHSSKSQRPEPVGPHACGRRTDFFAPAFHSPDDAHVELEVGIWMPPLGCAISHRDLLHARVKDKVAGRQDLAFVLDDIDQRVGPIPSTWRTLVTPTPP